ncbi:MAG: tol-pal system protein YbgF [Pseudomonadota bacterium]
MMMRTVALAVAAMCFIAALALPAKAQNAAQNQAAIFQMQEQMRQLNGRVEELTFQLLELQELLRQSREDNEARFLDLEEGSQQGAVTPPSAGNSNTDFAQTPQTNGDDLDGVRILGTEAAPLGTLRFDENGNLIEGALGRPLDLNQAPVGEADDVIETAELVDGNSDEGPLPTNLPAPGALYQQGYNEVLGGNYVAAERTFRTLLRAYPESDRAPNARYWLAESLFAMGSFNDAAETYLEVVNGHPDTQIAPDAMLKLGVTLAGLGEVQTACETFEAVTARYPATPDFFRQRLDREMRSARCG